MTIDEALAVADAGRLNDTDIIDAVRAMRESAEALTVLAAEVRRLRDALAAELQIPF